MNEISEIAAVSWEVSDGHDPTAHRLRPDRAGRDRANPERVHKTVQPQRPLPLGAYGAHSDKRLSMRQGKAQVLEQGLHVLGMVS